MITDFPFIPAMWSYGFAALIFAAFAIQFSIGWRGGVRASVLVCAVVSSALWAGAVLASLAVQTGEWWWMARVMDAIRVGAWLAFLLLLIVGWRDASLVVERTSSLPWVFSVISALLLAGALLPLAPPWIVLTDNSRAIFSSYTSLGASVFGLALAEQLYRRTPQNRRWAIKPLVIGLGGMFALDLLIFSSAVLFRHLDSAMWATRGIAHGLVVFFVAIATARNAAWTINLYIYPGKWYSIQPQFSLSVSIC